MALEIAISQFSLDATGKVANIKDLTSYTNTSTGWGESGGANPNRVDTALIVFCTLLKTDSADNVEVDLLTGNDPKAVPETSDANNPTYLTNDVDANGDGIYFYEAVALKENDEEQASVPGYFWKAATSRIVNWDGTTETELTAEEAYAVKSSILSSTNNDGYLDDAAVYGIVTTKATKARDELARDLTDGKCNCGTDISVSCDCCIDKKKLYAQIRLQIEGALANYAVGAYTNASKNFDMIEAIITEINYPD